MKYSEAVGFGLMAEGRREVLLDKDFFVGFGKTILKRDEVVLSVFIPTSRKVRTPTTRY